MFALSSYKNYNNSGYIALMSVVIIGAAGAAIAVSVILLGLASSRSSLASTQSSQAKASAEACAEQALQNIRNSSVFSGSGQLVLDSGTCSYEVIDRGGESRSIFASGTVETVVRKLRIDISAINPMIACDSWQEVEN